MNINSQIFSPYSQVRDAYYHNGKQRVPSFHDISRIKSNVTQMKEGAKASICASYLFAATSILFFNKATVEVGSDHYPFRRMKVGIANIGIYLACFGILFGADVSVVARNIEERYTSARAMPVRMPHEQTVEEFEKKLRSDAAKGTVIFTSIEWLRKQFQRLAK